MPTGLKQVLGHSEYIFPHTALEQKKLQKLDMHVQPPLTRSGFTITEYTI